MNLKRTPGGPPTQVLNLAERNLGTSPRSFEQPFISKVITQRNLNKNTLSMSCRQLYRQVNEYYPLDPEFNLSNLTPDE